MSIAMIGRVVERASAAVQDFEGIREITVDTDHEFDLRPRARRARAANGKKRFLEVAPRTCHLGRPITGSGRCSDCPRFVNFKPSNDGATTTIRCLWTGRDSVSDLMMPVSTLLPIPAESTVAEAAARLAEHDDAAVGIVTHNDLLLGVFEAPTPDAPAPADDLVRTHMRRRLWTVPPSASLADAVSIVCSQNQECVGVIANGALEGIVTRRLLASVGAPIV